MSATAQLRAAATRTANAAPEFESLLQRSVRSTFDPAAWHAMQERDNQLIRDQVLHGYASKDFVYSFNIQGKTVTGVSVVGARELASEYGGIKARIVATVEKRGALFIFRTFTPLSIETRRLPELSGDDDFYECVLEVQDIKTGNSIEVRKKETRQEKRRDGSTYERPHYDVIAESKAFRNGVLSVLPQNVVIDFEKRCLAAGNKSDEKTIDQLRDGVIAFAAKSGIGLDRKAVAGLSYAEINGLGSAAKEGLDAFKGALLALGVVQGQDRQEDAGSGAEDKPEQKSTKGSDPDTKQDADLKAGIELSGDDAPAGPSLQDALALVAKGDDAGAQDLAGQLGPAAKAAVTDAIEKRNGAQQPQQRTARRTARDISAE